MAIQKANSNYTPVTASGPTGAVICGHICIQGNLLSVPGLTDRDGAR